VKRRKGRSGARRDELAGWRTRRRLEIAASQFGAERKPRRTRSSRPRDSSGRLVLVVASIDQPTPPFKTCLSRPMSLDNASSDDEPVVVSFIRPKRPPVPPPVVFKGGKLPAFKKRRLDDGHGSVQQQPPQPGPGAPELAPTRPKAQESDAVVSNGGDDGAVSESSSGLSSPPPESERERESSSDESEREVGSAPDESDGDEVVVVERPLAPFARRFPKPPPAVLLDQEPGQAAKATVTATARVAESIPEPPVTSKQGQAPAAPSALPPPVAVDSSSACAAGPMLEQLGLSEPVQVAPFETTPTVTSTKTNGQLSAVPATAKALAAPTVEASSATVVRFDVNRPRRRGARYAADLALAELKAARAKRAVAAGAAATAATPRSPSPPRPPPIEVRPYVKPPDAPSGKLPSELLAMLVVAGAPLASGAAEPPDDVRETIIPLLRELLDGVKPALARLRAWDAGWEDMIIQRRIELAKSRFIRSPCVLGLGEAVEWPGREVYDRPWENTLCLWVRRLQCRV